MKFKHHKYTWQNGYGYGSVRHNWELVGPNGAVNYHASVSKDYTPSCGLEFHHLSGDGAPDHVNCPLTGGRCWHDGTSLYASENWPFVESCLKDGDHAILFSWLEHEYSKHFEKEKE